MLVYNVQRAKTKYSYIQGSCRQVCVKFKDFSRTSKRFSSVFKDNKFMKKTDLHNKIPILKS